MSILSTSAKIIKIESTGPESKEYSGVSPINVDNTLNTISIDNSALSGKDWSTEIESATSGKQDTLSFGYTDNKISSINTSALYTPDTEYTAGSNINITNKVISGKDWSNEISSSISSKQDKLTAGSNIFIGKGDAIIKTITGNSLPITFTANGDAILNYTIYGTLIQDGVPSIDSPKDILGVGPTINVKRNGALAQAIFINEPLYSINGYTDYISYEDKQAHYFSNKLNLSLLDWTAEISSGKYRFYTTLPDFKPSVAAGRDPKVLLNRFYYSTQDAYGVGFGHSNGRLYIYVDSSVQTVAQLQEWLSVNNSYVVYPTNERVETLTNLPELYTDIGTNTFDITPVRPTYMSIKYIESSSNETIISAGMKSRYFGFNDTRDNITPLYATIVEGINRPYKHVEGSVMVRAKNDIDTESISIFPTTQYVSTDLSATPQSYFDAAESTSAIGINVTCVPFHFNIASSLNPIAIGIKGSSNNILISDIIFKWY